jgi:hypothetical protein
MFFQNTGKHLLITSQMTRVLKSDSDIFLCLTVTNSKSNCNSTWIRQKHEQLKCMTYYDSSLELILCVYSTVHRGTAYQLRTQKLMFICY